MNKNFKQTTISLFILLLFIITNTSNTYGATLTNTDFQSEEDIAILKGLEYIATQMNADGGIRWMDESSDVATSIRVVLALAAGGFPQSFLSNESQKHPIDFIKDAGVDWAYHTTNEELPLNVARAGQLLTAVAAANENPHAFGKDSVDLISLIKSSYDTNTAVFGEATKDNVMDQVWAILGLSAINASVPLDAVNWLAGAQLDDGSWNDGFGSFLDTTPLAVMALIALDEDTYDSATIQTALNFIWENQQADGGWQTEWDTTINANTTGMILQAIHSLKETRLVDDWLIENREPTEALLNLQQDNGVIGGDFANTYSTADAILGLSGQPFYDLSTLRRVSRAYKFLFDAQQADGGWASVGQTIDVLFAIHAAGWDPNTVTQNGTSPLQYLSENLEPYLENGPDAIGKSIIAVVLMGEDPTNFSNLDLVDLLMQTYDPEASAFGTSKNTWHQALAILGLNAANVEIPEGVIQSLINLQLDEGGWDYMPGFGFPIDSTALVIQALLAANYFPEDDGIQAALDFILSQQSQDGGWGDASTTAYVMMALNAIHSQPDDWLTDVGKTPQTGLFRYQNPSGAFRYSDDFPEANVMATSTALYAILSGDYLISSHDLINRTPENMAGMVISTDNGEIFTACISFNTDTISGLALLENSGFTYTIQDGFVNSILEAENPPGGTLYWSYWQWDGRDWVFNPVGAKESQVLHGGIEAWYLTSWEQFPSLPPNFIPNLSEICDVAVRKSYISQPFINYNDLLLQPITGETITEPIEDIISPEVTVTQTLEVFVDEPGEVVIDTLTSVPTATRDDPEVSTRSTLPFVILGVVGIAAVIFVIVLFTKKAS